MAKQAANDAMYWDTNVPLKKSLGEIGELLDEYGSNQTGTSKHVDDKGNITAITVFFVLDGLSYRATFEPLKPEMSSRTRRTPAQLREQALMQMGRVAWYWLKTALMMHQMGHPEALAPYLMLSAQTQDGRKVVTTIQEQGAEWVLQQAGGMLALPANTEAQHAE